MIVVLDGADLHVEGAQDHDARRGLERFLNTPRAVLEHGQAGKAVANDDFSLRPAAADFVDDRLAQNTAALGGLLADIGRLHRGPQEIELYDRNAAGDDVV